MATIPAIFIEDHKLDWSAAAPDVQRKIMAWDQNLMLVKVDFKKGAIGSLHSHPHVQISYVESGSFEVEIGGVKQVLKTGDVFYVPSGAVHGVVCLEEGLLIDVFNPAREDFMK
jgi:quercetin dioxygenase-like cupin family protein